MRFNINYLLAAVIIGSSITVANAPDSAAENCSDVEVVFARGTGDAPGIGWLGEAFTDKLRDKLDARTLTAYGVNYPASNDWPTGVAGIADAKTHIMETANSCPSTKIVVGGFSQGAAVAGFVTSDRVPDGVDPSEVPSPMPVTIADHVAAVVLFGTPNERAMQFLGQPNVSIGPAYADKTLKLCAEEDPVCSDGLNFSAHNSYNSNGMTSRAAEFAFSKISGKNSSWN